MTDERFAAAATKFQNAATSYGISFGMDGPIKEKLDELANARAAVLALYDEALAELEEAREAAVLADDVIRVIKQRDAAIRERDEMARALATARQQANEAMRDAERFQFLLDFPEKVFPMMVIGGSMRECIDRAARS